MGAEKRDEVVEHPTFLEHVRFFFDPIDIEHMQRVSKMDLATYEGVKGKATQIYFQTSTGRMPTEPERRWPVERVQTFRNWIIDRFPMGSTPVDRAALARSVSLSQFGVRRDVASLSEGEAKLLAKGFAELMEREPSNSQSYFALAGIHWYPEPFFCVHHEPRYNSWHRVYVDRFEAALRSVPGCENISLPYWDVLAPLPEWLFKPPFDSYTLPIAVSGKHPAGHRTQRHSRESIHQELAAHDVRATIHEALNSPSWERFNRFIEQAHDDGHVSCGPTMQTPDIASFDPLFWFFHCNWERMWWAWQKRYQATNLADFRKRLDSPDEAIWLDTAPFNELQPFDKTADTTIDSSGYSYEDAAADLFNERAVVESGSVPLARTFRLNPSDRLSVRVKDIARLKLDGTFVVHLFAEGEDIARHALFQAREPLKCVNCVAQEKVSVDFIVDRGVVANKNLEVRIETLATDRVDRWVALSEVGNPTINIRELLTSE